jgi:transposase InsO family protein
MASKRSRTELVSNVSPITCAAMTAQLVTDALVMAIWRRGKPDALLHHSDRGSQSEFKWSSQRLERASYIDSVLSDVFTLGLIV